MLLVVNVASECGLTKQYKELESSIDAVVASYDEGRPIDNLESAALPNKRAAIEALRELQPVLFAGFYATRRLSRDNLRHTLAEHLYRAHDLLGYRTLGHRKWPEGAFIPNILSLDVPSGEYLLTVQLNDRASERKGIYRHRIHVESYAGEELRLSDIQLGWNISDQRGDEKFRKGDIWVIPMTTRAYREDQNAHVYYELYNLARNTFGETRYRVTYTISAEDPKRPFNLLRSSVGSLTKMFTREDKTQVTVSFDQVGNELTTTGYFELSLKKVKSGYNRLSITVEDLTSQQVAAKEILFRYKN